MIAPDSIRQAALQWKKDNRTFFPSCFLSWIHKVEFVMKGCDLDSLATSHCQRFHITRDFTLSAITITETLLHKHNHYAFFATNITPRKSVVIMDNLLLNPHPTSNTLSVYGVHIRFSSCISNPQSTIVFFSSSYDNSMLLP